MIHKKKNPKYNLNNLKRDSNHYNKISKFNNRQFSKYNKFLKKAKEFQMKFKNLVLINPKPLKF